MRIVLLMVCMFLAAGCATKKTSPAAVPAPASSSTTGVRPDEVIGREVRYRIATQCPGDTATITIMVNDGVVTLRGSAASQMAAWRAQAAATAAPGVKAVRNELLVRGW